MGFALDAFPFDLSANGTLRGPNGTGADENPTGDAGNADKREVGRNNLQNAPLDVLAAKARVFHDAAATDPAAVGLTPEDVASIGAGLARFEERMREAVEAEASLRGAVQSRMAARESLLGLVAGAANRVYAWPGIAPAAITGLGLSPRSTTRARVVPRTPEWIVAEMVSSHVARARWARSANAAEVVFMLEQRVQDGPWEHVASVTRTQADVAVTPGVETWLRVRATKGRATAAPSPEAVLYLASEGWASRAAA